MNTKTIAVLMPLVLAISALPGSAGDDKLKVYISVDMEGICGVVHEDQTSSSGKGYGRARVWMTEETNAAIEGALQAGATEVVVNDSHGSMRNILIDQLHPGADLISGSPKPLSMMQGIGTTYDAVVFIGYHAGMGTRHGILDHTMSSRRVANVVINGVVMNEAALNAAIAGCYGVPVVFIAGDKAAVEQTRKLLGSRVEAAVVKEACGRTAARNVSRKSALAAIRDGVRRGVTNRKAIPVYRIKPPVKLEMEVVKSNMADNLELIPNAKRISGRKVVYTCDDFIEAFKVMRAMLILAAG